MPTLVIKKNYSIALAALLFAASALPGFAQVSASKGQILGTVFDSSDAVVTGATVTATNEGTGFSRNVETDEAGRYQFQRLDPGVYQVTAQAPSFAIARVEDIVLTVGGSVSADIKLQVQETVTSIDVVATLLAASDPAPSTEIPDSAITNLPINGRRFQDFATLTPTVQVESQRGTLSFVGQRGVNGNVMLDGGDYNNPFFGGIRGGERANLVPTVPQSAVQEFSVVTTGYTAEFGRSTGGLLNVVTKSGTNEYHGNAFWQVRDGAMSLEDPIFKVQTAETQHQFGGGIGGPIVRNKMFFFGAVERQNANAPRNVQFSRLNTLSAIDTTQEAFNFYKSQQEPFDLTNDATALTSRWDYNVSNGDQITLRYNFSDANGQNAVNTGNSLTPFTTRALSNDGVEKDRTHTGTASYTKILNPNLLNDFRFNGTYELRPRLNNSNTPELTTLIGTTGGRSFLPTTEDDIRFQIGDSLSWIKGGHTVKVGFDYNFVNAAQTFGFNQFGAFNISGSVENDIMEIMSVGGATANRFDSPAVTYNRQIGNLEASMDMQQSALFAQDSWRVNQQLTLNFGLRWEGQFNPSPQATNQALVGLVKGVRSPLGTVMDPTKIPNAAGQVMPRFGFAWSPGTGSRKTVVRGHTGLFYASTPLLLFADSVNNFRDTPGNLSVTMRNSNGMSVYDQFLSVGVDLNQYSLDNLPILSVDQAIQAISNGLGTAPTPFVGAAVQMIAPDFRNPRSFQIGLGVEREITSNLVAGVQANYVNTVRLQRNRDHNLAPATALDGSLRPIYGLRSGGSRPISSLSSITLRESTARSMYRGITFKLERRGRRLSFGANYTVSETFSDDDNERSSSGFNAEDQFNLKPDYNYSVLDARHQFTSYAVSQLPFGLELSGSFTVHSGRPLNPTAGSDANQDLSNFSDRPYQSLGVVYPRFSFRDRSVVTANNLRVMKNFNLSDTVRVQLSAEMFNLFNIDNVVLGSSFGDDTYGLGLDPVTGQTVAPRTDFMRLRLPDGSYDPTNRQDGAPFQAQFGARLFF